MYMYGCINNHYSIGDYISQTYRQATDDYVYHDRHFGRSVTEETAKEGQLKKKLLGIFIV